MGMKAVMSSRHTRGERCPRHIVVPGLVRRRRQSWVDWIRPPKMRKYGQSTAKFSRECTVLETPLPLAAFLLTADVLYSLSTQLDSQPC